jgi:thiopeptide-type bacteriocin biosynthesis protein
MDYFIYEHCHLRLATFPIDDIIQVYELSQNCDLQDNKAILRLLEKLFGNNLFKEALFITSRDFYNQYLRVQKEATNKDLQRFLEATMKYYARMAYRTTPFGLFAGTSSLKVSPDQTSILFSNRKYRIHVQLSLNPIVKLIREIDTLDSVFVTQFKYFNNNTSYTMGDRIYFIEQFEKNGYPASNLNSIALNKYTSTVLACAKKGATIQEIIDKLPDEAISYERKLFFLRNLIKSQVLVNELWPSVSSEDFMADFLLKVRDKNIENGQFLEIGKLKQLIDKTDKIENLPKIRELISTNSDTAIFETKDLLKSDLYFNLSSGKVNKNVIENICSTSFELMSIAEPYNGTEDLKLFIQKFYEKYDQQVLPLLEVLDPTYGIGYGVTLNGGIGFTPLLEDVPFYASMSDENQRKMPQKQKQIVKAVIRKYIVENSSTIQIDDIVHKVLQADNGAPKNKLKSSSFIFGNILSKSTEALDKMAFKFIPVLSHAPSATRLLSRFANGDPDVKEHLLKIAIDEQRQHANAILAEVVTIPDGEYANVCLSPVLRDYEIPYISNSNLPVEFQINLEDIQIKLVAGEVKLLSRKLGKEIIPCFSNSYNVLKATPIFRFLADVSSQYMNFGYSWTWGEFNHEAHLPRVEYKNFILSRERWYVPKDEKALNVQYLVRLQNDFHLPRYVVLSEGDNELMLDLANPVCAHILCKEIKKNNVILYEFLHRPEHCFIKDHMGSYSSSVLISMGIPKTAPTTKKASQLFPASSLKLNRSFAPGSEWLYVKIYSGAKLLEDLLTNLISDFAKTLVEADVIDCWFFVRYNDPEYHLRIRFHKSTTAVGNNWYLIMEKLQALIKEYLNNERVVKIMIDTYQREIERYGVETMEVSEALFFRDSVATINFLTSIRGNVGEEQRWKFAFLSVDELMEDFGLSDSKKYALTTNLSEFFLAEFAHDDSKKKSSLVKSLNAKYRTLRQQVNELMESKFEDPLEALEYIHERSREIKKLLPSGNFRTPLSDSELLPSYIHMCLNRIFLSNARRHELVLYNMMSRFYRGKIAQLKQYEI